MHITPVTTGCSRVVFSLTASCSGYWCKVHTHISRLGTHLSPKLCFAECGWEGYVFKRHKACGKQSFQDTGIPNQEIWVCTLHQ